MLNRSQRAYRVYRRQLRLGVRHVLALALGRPGARLTRIRRSGADGALRSLNRRHSLIRAMFIHCLNIVFGLGWLLCNALDFVKHLTAAL